MDQRNATGTRQNPHPDNMDTDEESEEEFQRIHPSEITVAIFCALSCESVAVKFTLDSEFQCRPDLHPHAQKYVYAFGQIGPHKVVITRPNQMGKVNAAHMAATISQQFPNVRFALMVGIGAGIPNKWDIRLGDIAVSIPQESHPGVIEYDFGKSKKDGFTLKGFLNKPPSILLSADGQLDDAERMNKRPLRKILRSITKHPGYERPGGSDMLFDPSFDHVNEGQDCSGCEASSERRIVNRPPRSRWPNEPVVHRGLVLSGSLVVKNPKDRDLLCRGYDAICYEMEAAGIMDEIPCLVIRGICDYADTHKQDIWHCYAAAAAAAYAKGILCKIDGQDIEATATMKEMMTQVETKVDAIGQDLSNLRRDVNAHHKETKHIEILEWLYPGAASSARHSAIVSARQVGTGKWFVTQAVFSRWLTSTEESSRILWCYGIPGAGKSTISSVVIDYLDERRAQNAKILAATAYFYFDSTNKEIDTRKFARSLLKQLAFQSPNLPDGLIELFKTYSGSGKTEIEDQKIKDLLVQLATNFHETYIVVDALDECVPEQRFHVLELLHRLAGSGAKIFTTSRPHPEDVNEMFKAADKVELGANTQDIRKYIRAEIMRYHARTPKERHIRDELIHRIIDVLCRMSNGMFLLPKLQLKFLLRQATRSRIENILEKIVKMSISEDFHPIDETFNLMLESIDECNRDIAERALSWLLVTEYPLRIQDLLVALAIESGNTEITDHQQLLQSTVLDICAGFIVVEGSSDIVKLAHGTVQDYLLRKSIDVAGALASLTRCTLNYLRFERFTNPLFWDTLGQDESALSENIKLIPFYLYSIRNWEALVARCNQDAIEGDLISFLSQRSSVISYCQARKLTLTNQKLYESNRWSWFYRIGTDESPLHLAARTGNLGAIRYFISHGDDIDIRHDGGHQPIWEAVAYGQFEAVKLLVENGSSPRAAWVAGRRLIHFASARGDYSIVKYLLELDPEMVNIQQEDGSSPLRECAFSGHVEVARLLLDAGANWLLETHHDRRTVGFLALEQGWSNVFSLILKKGLSLKNPLHIRSCNAGTPLHIAAGYGYEETVKEILELGATNERDFDISITDLAGNTALHNAVNTGILSIVKLLVENGIDLERKNKAGKTALELATQLGDDPVKHYLRGAIAASSWDPQEFDTTSTPQGPNTLPEPPTAGAATDRTPSISLPDVTAVYNILTQKINLPLIARKILDYAEYWIEQHVKNLGTVVVSETSLPTPYINLNVCGPFVRKIIFRTVSHDQGWSGYAEHHGTYEGSCTWIEVWATLKDHLSIEPGGENTHNIHKRSKPLQIRRLQYNVHARRESTEHMNEWNMATASDPELVDFLSTLCSGDRVSLYPRAMYMGWECFLDEAEMWVYSAPWDLHSKYPYRIGQAFETQDQMPTATQSPEIGGLVLSESKDKVRGRDGEIAEEIHEGSKRKKVL
ncbi:hypothetical protein TWF718_010779 [Orbilia javanica]|uniref:Nucleoside phosphorylase domain-containing protein n=1 Tax=Orbilia javanica TaxID=47235 RepID=A0AAN8NMT8_9PEZI